MGHVEAAHLSHALPDGRVLLDDISFRVGEGSTAALIGPNGAGKTTLMRLIAGDLTPQAGSVTSSGGLGVMRQFIGGIRDESTVRDLLLSISSRRVREAAARLDGAELAMMERDDEPTQLRYAAALADWGDAGGYDAEVHFDACCSAALGVGYERCQWREVRTLSGGEQKRLVLESLLRGKEEVLLLDEPDNYLDVPAKLWLEQQLAATPKTVLLVSHDRELLASTAERIITVEDRNAWTHGGGFAGYAQARRDRNERLDELRRRWDEEHEKLKQLVRMYRLKASYNDGMASRLHAAETRLRKFEEEGPARAGSQGAERADAAARRTYRQAGSDLREPRAQRPDAPVRPGGLVRRAGSGARLQRLGQVTVPAAAGRRGGQARRRRPARGQGRARHLRPDTLARRPAEPKSARGAHDRARTAY
jgi:ATPase subunit of ABC transporter with duplicated ATPase domains